MKRKEKEKIVDSLLDYDSLLKDLGCYKWSKNTRMVPGKYLDKLPDGFRMWDILGKKCEVGKGKLDDDSRGGMSPYYVKSDKFRELYEALTNDDKE